MGALKYRDRFITDVVDHCGKGHTLRSFCVIANITMSTLNKWRKEIPDFDDACNVAQNSASLFYQDLLIEKAKSGDFNAMKMMIKSVDKDFNDKIQVDANHSVVYKIDLGEVAGLVTNNRECRDVIDLDKFKQDNTINERELEGRHERGAEDSNDPEVLLIGEKADI